MVQRIKNTTFQNLWDKADAVLKRKFIDLSTYIRKKVKIKI